MIQNIRKERGVTMITVTIAIIILLIITGILVYNADDMVYIKNYNALKNDIELLKSKVSVYYNEYGTVPAKVKYTAFSDGIDSIFNEIELENKDDFYVLDLQVLDGLTLNYGKDYEKVKNLSSVDEYYSDLYIINSSTHNIFLNGGVEFKDGDTVKYYYTDYEKPDENRVDFRYVDGIKIPDGYYYIGRDDNQNIVISLNIDDKVNLDDANQYHWIDSEEILEDAVLQEGQTLGQYKQSVSENKGYFLNDKTKYVIYFDVKVSLPETDDTSPYLPDEDSTILEGTTLETGLVVMDSKDNEWVWIEVPKSIFTDEEYTGGQNVTSAEGEENLQNIEKILQNYAKDYRYDNWEDLYFDDCGIESEEYNNLKNKMLKSVFENGGFWIGRYEAGADDYVSNDDGAARDVVVQKNKFTYNWVNIAQAQSLSSTLSTNPSRTSSLMFGIQWDLVCKYIEAKNVTSEEGTLLDEYLLTHNCVEFGNYSNAGFDITTENAQQSIGDETDYSIINQDHNKNVDEAILLTTGASDRNKIMNIYDLGGNQFEITLEKSKLDDYPVTVRGGSYRDAGFFSSHDYTEHDIGYKQISFRPTIF